MIFYQRMADQPSCADTEKMLDRGLRKTCCLQFFLKGGKHLFAKVFMDASVGFESRIMDGGHIGFLIRKMLNGMVFKILDRFLAGKVAFFLSMSEIKQFIENVEQFFVFFVYNVHSDIILFIPHQTIFHVSSSRSGISFYILFYSEEKVRKYDIYLHFF